MASIYKRTRDKGKKNKPYHIEYLDADGERGIRPRASPTRG